MTPERKTQARLTARSIIKAYGSKARRRAHEISSGVSNLSEDNREFYAAVSEFINEGLDSGTIDGQKVVWR